MVAYDDNSVDVIDLTSNSHIGTNTRNNYYHILKNIMTFLFTNSPGFFVFRLKKYIYHLQYIKPQRIVMEINLKYM